MLEHLRIIIQTRANCRQEPTFLGRSSGKMAIVS